MMLKKMQVSLMVLTLVTALFPLRVSASEYPSFLSGSYRGLPKFHSNANPASIFRLIYNESPNLFFETTALARELAPDVVVINGKEYRAYYDEFRNFIVITQDGEIILERDMNRMIHIHLLGFGVMSCPNLDPCGRVMLFKLYQFRTPVAIMPIAVANHIRLHELTGDDEIYIPGLSDNGNNDGDDGWLWSWDDISNFIMGIFVPREDFWEYHFDRLDGRLREKLPFQTYIETIGRLREVSGALDGDASVFDITYVLNGQEFHIDIGRHIAPYLQQVRTLVTGVYVILLAYYNYRQVVFLIRGRNYQSGRGNDH